MIPYRSGKRRAQGPQDAEQPPRKRFKFTHSSNPPPDAPVAPARLPQIRTVATSRDRQHLNNPVENTQIHLLSDRFSSSERPDQIGRYLEGYRNRVVPEIYRAYALARLDDVAHNVENFLPMRSSYVTGMLEHHKQQAYLRWDPKYLPMFLSDTLSQYTAELGMYLNVAMGKRAICTKAIFSPPETLRKNAARHLRACVSDMYQQSSIRFDLIMRKHYLADANISAWINFDKDGPAQEYRAIRDHLVSYPSTVLDRPLQRYLDKMSRIYAHYLNERCTVKVSFEQAGVSEDEVQASFHAKLVSHMETWDQQALGQLQNAQQKQLAVVVKRSMLGAAIVAVVCIFCCMSVTNNNHRQTAQEVMAAERTREAILGTVVFILFIPILVCITKLRVDISRKKTRQASQFKKTI